MEKKYISLIIPTYNEAPNLQPLIEEILNVVDPACADIEFIIVDDNSPDGTGRVADELTQTYPVRVIHRTGKLGLGSAVIEGIKKSTRPYCGVMDADLSHDPIILNDMIRGLDEYDIVMGSRFAQGSAVEQWAWYRKALSNTGVFFARLLTGVKDPLSGYFLFKREVVGDVSLSTVGYKILLEILVKGTYNGVKEYPYTFRMRRFSASKLNTKEYLLFAKQLIEYAWYKLVHPRRRAR